MTGRGWNLFVGLLVALGVLTMDPTERPSLVTVNHLLMCAIAAFWIALAVFPKERKR